MMCSHMLTPEEHSGVVLQMSMHVSRMIPAAVLTVYLSRCIWRQSPHLPSYFILCDDKDINWTRLNETDEDVFILHLELHPCIFQRRFVPF